MPIYNVQTGSSTIPIAHLQVPKTGGSSIANYFQYKLDAQMFFGTEMKPIRPLLRCPPQHYHYALLNELVVLDKAAVGFCVVRNPIARIESDYVWAMTNSPMRNRPLSFDDWVTDVFTRYERNPYVLANHIRPQHEFVGPAITAIFKYEDGLDAAITQVLQLAGVSTEDPVKLERVNTRAQTKAATNLRTEMSAATRDKITRFYERDFAAFGYQY